MKNPVRDYRFMKRLAIIVAMLFTAYPVVELTRCILQYNILPGLYPPGYPEGVFVVEICIIWIGWLFVPFIIRLAFDKGWQMARQAGGR